MKITVHPLTPARWPDLEAVFLAKGCSIARGCWCMYYRETGRQELRPAPVRLTHGAHACRQLAAADPPPGLDRLPRQAAGGLGGPRPAQRLPEARALAGDEAGR
jgi:hypothetical protein